MADYHFNFQGATIDNGSSGIHTFVAGDVQATPASDAIVTELREIRRKLEKGPDSPQYIQTHIGVGYRMMKLE